MELDTASQALLIVVSSVLTVFLVVLIVLAVRVIQIVDSIKRVTMKAELVVDKVEDVAEFFRNTKGTFVIGRLLTNIAEAVKGKSNNKRRG